MGLDKKVKLTPLCRIAYKYGTDKCPQIKHSYTTIYYELFKDKTNRVKKILEFGIGHYKGMENQKTCHDPGLDRLYHRGASLYMWREFFPNADVYGADIVKEAVFDDERIQTFVCDERDEKQVKQLINKIGSDIDIVVDDASHKVNDQIKLAQTLLPLLRYGATYVIEDVGHSKKIAKALDSTKYNFYTQDVPRNWPGGMMFVINK